MLQSTTHRQIGKSLLSFNSVAILYEICLFPEGILLQKLISKVTTKNKTEDVKMAKERRRPYVVLRLMNTVDESLPKLLRISISIFQIDDSTMWLNIHR